MNMNFGVIRARGCTKDLPHYWLAQTVSHLSSGGGRSANEEEMATHSSILAWRIPGTEEPGHESVTEQQPQNMTMPT